jgi:hypothetical protein
MRNAGDAHERAAVRTSHDRPHAGRPST